MSSTLVIVHPVIPLRCNLAVPKNICFIVTTFDVSNASKPRPANKAVSLNIDSMEVTLLVSNALTSPLKDVAAWTVKVPEKE